MEILFTFRINEVQEKELVTRFPTNSFHFNKSIDDRRIQSAKIIVTYGNDINEAVLGCAENLKWVMVASAGVESMPLKGLKERGIIVTNVRGIHKTPMAESVLAHILALQRGIIPIKEFQNNKEWGKSLKLKELKGSTAIIIGPGAIGSEVGRLLQAFGVKTIGCSRSGLVSDSMNETIVFNRLLKRLPEADFVISILPSTRETENLLTADYFDAMKKSAIFMNFGRGDLLNEDVLIKVLKNNEIAHAVLDVFEVEPLPSESELWLLPNCTVSPHISSHSNKYIERSLTIFQKNLHKWLNEDGNLVNLIDLERGY